LLALLGAHHFLHVSRIRVKSLTFRLLMIYIYIYDISRLRVKIEWSYTPILYMASWYGRGKPDLFAIDIYK